MKSHRTLAGIFAFMCALSLVSGTAFAAPPGGGGPGGSSSSVSWSGATTITSATTQSNKTYTSTSADQNALLINTSGAVSISNPTVNKSGGTSASDNYSFYGINSGIMVKGGTTTTITGGTVSTSAAGANGVFSYGANSGQTNATGDGTTVKISDTTITTTGNGSGGIMTTYGGTTIASNLTVTTSGGSSAPIRTDRGGGWVTVSGGTYTSSGVGSPAIYSTADVSVSNATLVSKASEGVCIEGNGSITLNNVKLTASNTTKNGNAQYYDTIMIYQSMSGDATGTDSVFSMTGGTLTSNKGHVFHVTNTSAEIDLNGVEIVNNDSDGILLSVVNDGWSGNSNVATVNATAQELEGDIIVSSASSSKSSSASSLTLNLKSASVFTGKIDDGAGSDNYASVAVSIDETSTWKLTGDSYVSSISGSGGINYNDCTLYVGGVAYTASNPYPGLSSVTSIDDEDSIESTGVWTRIWGDSAYDTMADVASEGWSAGDSSVAILATGENYPDALAAAGAAGVEGAPVIITMTSAGELSSQAKTVLQTLRPDTIIAVGGVYAMPESVLSAAKSAAGATSTVRLSGDHASDTAAEINLAYAENWSGTAFLATSLSYQDALSAAPLSYALHIPIFLVDDMDTVSDASYEAMEECGISQVIVLGGKYCVSDLAKADLQTHGIEVLTTLAGDTAYDTSAAIATWGLANGMGVDKMGVACGLNYPDALTGAALCGKNNSIIVLADKKNSATALALVKSYKASIESGYIFGGKYAVPNSVMAALEEALA